MKKGFACWSLLVLAASSAVAAGPVPLAPGQSPADNPLKGLVPYAHPKPGRFPHSMEFTYLPLSDLMTGPDQFNWKRLDDFLNGVAGRGNQAVFRVWLEYSGVPTGVPRFLIDQGVKIIDWTNRKDDPPTKNHAPDYSDERLVSAMESFIAALGRRYDSDPRIGFITAGLLGAGVNGTTDRERTFLPAGQPRLACLTLTRKPFRAFRSCSAIRRGSMTVTTFPTLPGRSGITTIRSAGVR